MVSARKTWAIRKTILWLVASTLIIGIPSQSKAAASTFNCPGGGTYSVLMPAGVLNSQSNCAGNLVIDSSVKIVYDNVFMNDHALTGVTFPEGLVSVGSGSFNNTDLVSIVLPTTTRTIGYWSLASNRKLKSVTLNAGLSEIDGIAFMDDTALTSIVIPDSVLVLGGGIFMGAGLKSVVLPAFITSIPGSTFRDNPLDSFTIPQGVTSIGAYAFYDTWPQSSISPTLTIPEGVTTLGDYSFFGRKFTSVNLPTSLTSIGASAFASMSNLSSLSIPNSVTAVGSGAFSGDTSLASISLSSNMTSISDGMLSGTAISTLTIPYGIQGIGGYALSGMQNLATLSIPSSVTGIGQWIVQGDSSLTSIQVSGGGKSVINIADHAFYGSPALESVDIQAPFFGLNNYTFGNDPSLTDVSLPSSLVWISSNAFSSDPSLAHINFCGSLQGFPITTSCNNPIPSPNLQGSVQTSQGWQYGFRYSSSSVSFQISNFEPTISYHPYMSYYPSASCYSSVTAGASFQSSGCDISTFTWSISSTGLLTFSNLPSLANINFLVEGKKGGYATIWSAPISTFTLWNQQTPLTPNLTNIIPTEDGYFITLSNFYSIYNCGCGYSWTNVAYDSWDLAGGAVSSTSNKGTYHITGLQPGQATLFTISALPDGFPYVPVQTISLPISVLNARLTPLFGTPVPTASGFKLQILNFDPLYSWSGANSANGVVSIGNTGLVTVTGLSPGTSSTLTVTTSRTGYASGGATSPSVTSSSVAQATLTIANTTLTGTVGTPITLSSAGGSGTGAVTYSVTGGGCSVTGTSLSDTSATTCVVTATKAASTGYLAATSVSKSFVFTLASQATLTITNSNSSPIAKGTAGLVLTTSGGSGTGAVTFSASSAGCSITNGKLTVATTYKSGSTVSCSVIATKAASGIYAATSSVAKSFNFA